MKGQHKICATQCDATDALSHTQGAFLGNDSAASTGASPSRACQPGTPARAAGCEWTSGETKLLLDLYASYFPQVGPLKKFRNKKAMFEKIATDINNKLGVMRTGEQCCSRYKTVLKRKNVAAGKNNTSGCSPQEVPYEAELEKIKWLDDSLEPEVVRDASGVVSKKTCPQSSTESVPLAGSSSSTSHSPSSSVGQDDTPDSKRKRPNSARELHLQTFFEKMKELDERRAERKAERDSKREERRLAKTQRREEMHKEKMNLLREIFNLKKNE
uniref:Putative e3 ubiquitin-protein ligase bre1a n=1 Tax=Rhipicephalus microplus TaxID=6941 RepID=A0A6M2CK41_RHIMP